MVRYTVQQFISVILIYYEIRRSLTITEKTFFRRNFVTSERAIRDLARKFKEYASLIDKPEELQDPEQHRVFLEATDRLNAITE